MIFLDTSYLIALLQPRDAFHAAAIGQRARLQGPLLTTEYVLMEFLDAMAAAPQRQKALAAVGRIRIDRRVRLFPASTELFERAIEMYESRLDKDLGGDGLCILFRHAIRRRDRSIDSGPAL